MLVAVIALLVWRDAVEQSLASALSKNGSAVALGHQVYQAQCASCHGANLEGQPDWRSELPTGGRPAPPHDETGHSWHHPDDYLFNVTKHGGQALSPPGYINNMPAFGDKLTNEEIRAVVAFIKSRWPPDILQAQMERSR